MKTYRGKLLAAAVIVVFGISGLSLARGFGAGGSNLQGNSGMKGMAQRTSSPQAILPSEMDHARVKILADLTGKSIDEIEESLKTRSFRQVMLENNVDFQTFQGFMHGTMVTVIQHAADDGKITKEQKDSIYEHMSTGSPKRSDQQGVGFQKNRGRRLNNTEQNPELGQ
ncbi:MAG: hypothetical protein GY786_13815 [Proteobacteria bacterium]|nr:hypothetical protein [Pseudomonadota bacterium]